MTQFQIEGKTISVYPGTAPCAPVIYLNTFDQEGERVRALLHAQGLNCALVLITGLDWNRDMAPWDAPKVFQKGEPFFGGADAYLNVMIKELVPRAEAALPGDAPWRGLAGYSLAGLFAVYALYQTALFARAACVSGSLWFPGFLEYARANQMKRTPERLYFSLGDREDQTRNPLLKEGRHRMEEMAALCEARGVSTAFRLSSGNHYQRAAERTAAGIGWILGGDA